MVRAFKPSPNPQIIGPPTVTSPIMLIQYIRITWGLLYRPHRDETPFCGDKGPMYDACLQKPTL
jgi:hypothetical protein